MNRFLVACAAMLFCTIASAEVSIATKEACKNQCASITDGAAKKASCLLACVKEKDGTLPDELKGGEKTLKDLGEYNKHRAACDAECAEIFTDKKQRNGCGSPCIVKIYAHMNTKPPTGPCSGWKLGCTILQDVSYEGCKQEYFDKACK